MKYKQCLECDSKFHYCSNCDFDPAQSDGFCSEPCRRKYYDYDKFLKFYKELISAYTEKYQKLFEFILDELWESWIYHKIGVKNDKKIDNT